jgi:hypothetical protein
VVSVTDPYRLLVSTNKLKTKENAWPPYDYSAIYADIILIEVVFFNSLPNITSGP